MPRPPKCRSVAFIPDVTYFKPAGVPLRMLEEIRLSIEEAESIRLKDMEGLEQEQGAEKMNISRPTFQRVLSSARQKIADALLNGKAIRIEGGNFKIALHRFRCASGHEWSAPFKPVMNASPQLCPVCDAPDITLLQQPVPGQGRGIRHCQNRGDWRK